MRSQDAGRNGLHSVRVEALEGRALLAAGGAPEVAPAVVHLGAGAATARLSPAPGQRVTVALRGPGAGTATVSNGLVDLVLEGTTAQTTVLVKAAGRGTVRLGRVLVHGPLASFRAPPVEMGGDVTFEGAVAEVLIGTSSRGGAAALGQRTLRLAPGTSAGAIRLGAVRDLTIDADGADIGTLAVSGWLDDEANGGDRVTANAITSLTSGTVRGNGKARAGVGDFQADVHAARLGAMSVAGDLSASSILVMPTGPGQAAAIDSVAVRGAMRGVKIVAMGDVGAVRAAGMIDTDVMAGVRYGVRADGAFEHVLPAASYSADFDFTGTYHVGEVAVTGAGGPARAAGRKRPRFVAAGAFSLDAAFVRSRVAAYDVGDVLLDPVSGFMSGGRQFGVAAYRVGSVVRRFADPSAPPADFVVRQTSAPLVFHEGPAGYGGYYGAGSGATGGFVTITTGGFFVNPPELPYVDVPAGGVNIGNASIGGDDATLQLMPDGVYELRGAAEALRDANLALLLLNVAGTPGTSMKVVHAPPGDAAAGVARFRSTSVSDSVDLVLPPASAKPYRVFVPTASGPEERLVRIPPLGEIVAAITAAGTRVDVFDRELLLVRPEGREIGRAYDDQGLRKLYLTEGNTFRVTGASGAVLWEGDDLLAALTGAGPRLGERRLPMRVVGKGQVWLHGLTRGGTAVLDFGGRQTLDPAGNVYTLPDGATLVERLRQAGVEFTAYEL
jgi:hypothetical protein